MSLIKICGVAGAASGVVGPSWVNGMNLQHSWDFNSRHSSLTGTPVSWE